MKYFFSFLLSLSLSGLIPPSTAQGLVKGDGPRWGPECTKEAIEFLECVNKKRADCLERKACNDIQDLSERVRCRLTASGICQKRAEDYCYGFFVKKYGRDRASEIVKKEVPKCGTVAYGTADKNENSGPCPPTVVSKKSLLQSKKSPTRAECALPACGQQICMGDPNDKDKIAQDCAKPGENGECPSGTKLVKGQC